MKINLWNKVTKKLCDKVNNQLVTLTATNRSEYLSQKC